MKMLFLNTLLLSTSLLAALDFASIDELKRHVLAVKRTTGDFCTDEKALKFVDLILETKPKICVEIGVYVGTSFFPIAIALKHLGSGVAVAIDPWNHKEGIRYLDPTKDKPNYDYWNARNYELIYFEFLNSIRRHSLENYCIPLKTTAEKAALALGEIDFLHLDGSHTDIGSIKDAELFLPKVRKGGYICINDTLWPEMQAAVELLLNACDVVDLIDNGNALLLKKR